MKHDVQGTAGNRADLCRFLAVCYYEPAAAFGEERLFESILGAAERVDPDLAECASKLGEAFAMQDLQALLVDYTRLFLGSAQPALAARYGSVWLAGEGALMQDSTMAVLDLYQQGGFDVDESIHDLPDHVAIELEFLYVLIFRQHDALRTGNQEESRSAKSLEQRLVTEHLGKWIGPFAQAVKSGAETPFYRLLVELTERFVRLQATLQNEP